MSLPAVPWPSSSLREIESRCSERLLRLPVKALPNCASCSRIGSAPLPFSRFSVTRHEARRRQAEVVHERVDLLLALGIGEQRRDRAVAACGRPRRSSPSSDWTDRIAPASDSLVSLPYFSSIRSLPDEALAVSRSSSRMALSEWSVALKLLPSCSLSSLLEVIAPRKPSPFSVRPRMFLSDLAIAERSVSRSPLPSRSFSRPAPGAARDLAADGDLGLVGPCRPRARCTCRRAGRAS